MHETKYTAGEDHAGEWWIIAPRGETGYRVSGQYFATTAVVVLNNLKLDPAQAYDLVAADPPPELVGGPGLDDEFVISGNPLRMVDEDGVTTIGTVGNDAVTFVERGEVTDDLTGRDWSYGGDRLDAAERVVAAWVVKGRSPAHHDKAKLRLRESWPVLYAALEALAAERGK